MKVEIKTSKKEFVPIVLNIKIENEQELCDLYHAFNVNSDVINENSQSLKLPANNRFDIHDELVTLIEQNNLYINESRNKNK